MIYVYHCIDSMSWIPMALSTSSHNGKSISRTLFQYKSERVTLFLKIIYWLKYVQIKSNPFMKIFIYYGVDSMLWILMAWCLSTNNHNANQHLIMSPGPCFNMKLIRLRTKKKKKKAKKKKQNKTKKSKQKHAHSSPISVRYGLSIVSISEKTQLWCEWFIARLQYLHC